MIVVREFNNLENAKKEYRNAKRLKFFAAIFAPGSEGWILHLVGKAPEQKSGKYFVMASTISPLDIAVPSQNG
jgi:hypothetical protein